ncbi:MAG: ATP-binding cassette domain-containing protein, partial [Yoonia sp.]
MLSVHDLAVARGGQTVLAGLTFDVTAGSALILRGANGIGKTTLLRTLAGLQDPVAGSYDYPAD